MPFGFRSVPAGKCRRLEPVEHEAVVVRLMVRLYIEGAGCKEISMQLNGAGMLRRGAYWSKNTVRNVLTNPAAKGYLRWSDRGREILTRSHKGIVAEEEFDMVTELMKTRTPRNVGGRPKAAAVFVGMLRCGHCGEAMMTETATGRAGTRYHYYNCRSHLKGIGCESRRVSVQKLDDALTAAICNQVFTSSNIRALVVELRRESSEFERTRRDRLDAFAAELSDVERRLRRLYESIEADSGLELADVAPRLRELRARQDNLKRAAAAVEAEEGPVSELSDAEVWQAAHVLKDIVRETEDPAKLRQFMERVVKKASIDGDEVTVDYWPESIVNFVRGSQCVVNWLSANATGRTKRVRLSVALGRTRGEAA